MEYLDLDKNNKNNNTVSEEDFIDSMNYLYDISFTDEKPNTSILKITYKDIYSKFQYFENTISNQRKELKALKKLLKEYRNTSTDTLHNTSTDTLSNSSNLVSKTTLKPRTRQISKNDIEQIKALKLQGLSHKAVSKITKWSTATISRVMKGDYND